MFNFVQVQEGENFNHRIIGDRFKPVPTGTRGLKFETDAEIGQKGTLCEGLPVKDSIFGGFIASGLHTIALTFRLFFMTGVLSNNLGW